MEKLNQWMTLLANIGVLAGIVFLAVETQQNTSAVRSQTAQETFQLSFDVLNSVAQGGNTIVWAQL